MAERILYGSEKEWYMEYEIARNRPGLLGDVSSILGMLNINIVTINGVDTMRRGMLLLTDDDEKMEVLRNVVQKMDNITITRLRPLPCWIVSLFAMDATSSVTARTKNVPLRP